MFHLPINDERIQSLTKEQIDFMIYANIADDPEKLRKLENYYYDPDFDEEFNKLDKEDNEISEDMEDLGFSFALSKNNKANSQDKNNEEDKFFNDEEDEFLEV